MIEAQGGDPRVVGDPSRLAIAPTAVPLVAERGGFVARVDALAVGLAAVAMGAGRARAEDKIDPSVGIDVLAKPGAKVEKGEPLAMIHVRDARDADAVRERLRDAFVVSEEPPAPRPLVLGRLDA